jgi:hypothetical protein
MNDRDCPSRLSEPNDGLMTLSEAREGYYSHTGKASDVARQLAFAGIALIWIFKKDSPGTPTIDGAFVPAAKWLVFALIADLLQYVLAAAIWGSFIRWKERQDGTTMETRFSAPPQLNWPGLFFFGAKIVCVFVGYCMLSKHIWGLFR